MSVCVRLCVCLSVCVGGGGVCGRERLSARVCVCVSVSVCEYVCMKE